MKIYWLENLLNHVKKNPIAILRFSEEEWENLNQSRYGPNEFTIARKHALLQNIKDLTPCVIIGKLNDDESIYFGLISSKTTITTLQTRIKIKRAVKVYPTTEKELLQLVSEKPYAGSLKRRLNRKEVVVTLSPLLSQVLVKKLSSIENNRGGMRVVAESLSVPKFFDGNDALQEDAIQTALSTFGINSKDRVSSLELVPGRETALVRVGINEDSVIEHDARSVPGFDLVGSDLTGRAVFEKNNERLEVITANRRPLEHCFGVDLIYLNLSKQNIVMLQYKMLEIQKEGMHQGDWLYRPDDQLDKEIQRMRFFSKKHIPPNDEYRLNPTVFYLKFVKRHAFLGTGSIITPLDHFEMLRTNPKCIGPKGAIRISYKNLEGSYLRQNSFFDLVFSGYIGSYSKTTQDLKTLIDGVLRYDKALITAIQRPIEGG